MLTRVDSFEPVGPFRVTGLPPGDYLVAAITRTDAPALDAGLAEPESLQQLSARAQRVTLAERERRTVALVVDSR